MVKLISAGIMMIAEKRLDHINSGVIRFAIRSLTFGHVRAFITISIEKRLLFVILRRTESGYGRDKSLVNVDKVIDTLIHTKYYIVTHSLEEFRQSQSAWD